jgi:D-lactate dehydrogenase
MSSMRVAVYSAKSYDVEYLGAAAAGKHDLVFLEPRLNAPTAGLASGFPAVSLFVNDQGDAAALAQLAEVGVRHLALRSTGYNHVDLEAAARLGIGVARVPAYSPHAVAEHTVALMLDLNRRIHRAYNRVRDLNFSLEGLLGFDLNGKTVGVVGTGAIGAVVVRILHGFGCRILAHDVVENQECVVLGARYVGLEQLLAESDIVTLHCPLTPETEHLIRKETLAGAKPGMMLINTSRGGLVDTGAVIEALKDGVVGYLGLDVYEEEADLFFTDLSDRVVRDDVIARLLTIPNVLVTGHQAFFTREALEKIAEVTVANLTAFEEGRSSGNEVGPERIRG